MSLDLVPQTEFSDYINLQKEIKRLSEDNEHLSHENSQLSIRLRNLESGGKSTSPINLTESRIRQDELENINDELKQENFVSCLWLLYNFLMVMKKN